MHDVAALLAAVFNAVWARFSEVGYSVFELVWGAVEVRERPSGGNSTDKVSNTTRYFSKHASMRDADEDTMFMRQL